MRSARRAQILWRVLAVLGTAVGYDLCAVIGMALSVPPSGFAIIWPGTAFLVAVLMVAPPRVRWLYLVGVIPAHLFLVLKLRHETQPLAVMLTEVGGNLVLSVATVLALEGARRERLRFDSFRSVLRFIILGAILVPAIGNALILGLHLLTGRTDAFWLSWRQWMLASLFPALTIPPALALAFHRDTPRASGAASMPRLELSILCAILFTLSYVAFGSGLGSAWWPELLLVSLPPMLWVAVRLSVGATSLALIVFATAIIARALEGLGPFAVNAAPNAPEPLQVFLTALSVPLLLLSALTQERRRTEELLAQSEARLQHVAASTETGLWQWDRASGELWMTDACRSMFGLDPAAKITPESIADFVHDDDRDEVRALLCSAFASGAKEARREFRVIRVDGEPRWFVIHTRPAFDGAGEPESVSGVFRDVTRRVRAQQAADEANRRLATLQEEERQRIAEELHESTGQNLAAVSLILSSLKRRINLSEGVGPLLEEAFASLARARNDLRTFTYLLRPAGLEQEGLCAILRRHVDGYSRWTGLQATLSPSPDVSRLPLETQRAFLRVVQESLTNVQRHAAATCVSIRFRRFRDDMHLVIRDDGVGLGRTPEPDAGTRRRPRVGIPGMTARVRQLRGAIRIRSRSGGTVVHAALPMADPVVGRAPGASAPRTSASASR